jgi:hypothetical protein
MSLTKVTYTMIEGSVANVLDFGADPTGVVDSLAAIDLALANGALTVIAGLPFLNKGSAAVNIGYTTVSSL